MANQKKMTTIILSLFCVCLFGINSSFAETANADSVTDVLPEGSQIIKNEVGFNANGNPICKQEAVYELNTASLPQCIVAFYSLKQDVNGEMHMAIIKQLGTVHDPKFVLLAECVVGGSYFWTQQSITFREKQDGSVVVYAAVAYGASVGAQIIEIPVIVNGKQVICSPKVLQKNIEYISFENDSINYRTKDDSTLHKIVIASAVTKK